MIIAMCPSQSKQPPQTLSQSCPSGSRSSPGSSTSWQPTCLSPLPAKFTSPLENFKNAFTSIDLETFLVVTADCTLLAVASTLSTTLAFCCLILVLCATATVCHCYCVPLLLLLLCPIATVHNFLFFEGANKLINIVHFCHPPSFRSVKTIPKIIQ